MSSATRAIAAPGVQPDPGAKTESREEQRHARIFLREKIDHRQNVVYLADPFVVHAFAEAHASKVEPRDGQPKPMDRFRGLVNHFVVHRPAKQRMRVADDRGQRRPRAFFLRGGPQDRFDAAGGAGKHQGSMRLRRHARTHVTTERRREEQISLAPTGKYFSAGPRAFPVAIFIRRCYVVANLGRPLPGE